VSQYAKYSSTLRGRSNGTYGSVGSSDHNLPDLLRVS